MAGMSLLEYNTKKASSEIVAGAHAGEAGSITAARARKAFCAGRTGQNFNKILSPR
jgi:hypothetical protein